MHNPLAVSCVWLIILIVSIVGIMGSFHQMPNTWAIPVHLIGASISLLVQYRIQLHSKLTRALTGITVALEILLGTAFMVAPSTIAVAVSLLALVLQSLVGVISAWVLISQRLVSKDQRKQRAEDLVMVCAIPAASFVFLISIIIDAAPPRRIPLSLPSQKVDSDEPPAIR